MGIDVTSISYFFLENNILMMVKSLKHPFSLGLGTINIFQINMKNHFILNKNSSLHTNYSNKSDINLMLHALNKSNNKHKASSSPDNYPNQKN